MFRTIAIVILTLALAGAGYFGFTQRSAYGNASKEIAELSDKLKEAEQKEEETADELKAAEEALEAIPPLSLIHI
jgi:septal ring factor EnvC (AmiA/AmiB activator)